MPDSDDGCERPKRSKTKKERLMAALKAVMRDRSSSRKNFRGRSRNRSRNGRRKGTKGLRSRTRDQPPWPRKKIQTLHEATHPESSTHHKRVAVCRRWPDQLDDTHRMSPVAQATPTVPPTRWLQGSAIGSTLTPQRYGWKSPKPSQTKCPTRPHSRWARPNLPQEFLSRMANQHFRTHKLNTKKQSLLSQKDHSARQQGPNAGSEGHTDPSLGKKLVQGRESTKRQQGWPEPRVKVELEEKLFQVEAAVPGQSQGNCPGHKRARKRKTLSSQAPQPQRQAQPVSPSARSSLQN